MIEKSQLIAIGRIAKPHGLKGEMTAAVADDIFDQVADCPYFVIEMEGIFVPFFIESYNFRSDTTILLKFDEIESQESAKELAGKEIYFDRKCFSPEEAEEYAAAEKETPDLIGYEVIDRHCGDLGKIIDIDDQTENVLFIIAHHQTELLVPAADDLIIEIDDEHRTILMDLPTGLVESDLAEVDQ